MLGKPSLNYSGYHLSIENSREIVSFQQRSLKSLKSKDDLGDSEFPSIEKVNVDSNKVQDYDFGIKTMRLDNEGRICEIFEEEEDSFFEEKDKIKSSGKESKVKISN